MSSRVVVISNPASLRLKMRSMLVEPIGTPSSRVPVEDLAMVVVESHGVTLTNELLVALTESGACVVHCDHSHLPTAMTLPLAGHFVHAEVLKAQIEASEPVKKRLWEQVIKAKIFAQAAALVRCDVPRATLHSKKLKSLTAFVRSGDPENVEARAARYYWEALFGDDFQRNRDEPGLNSLLNYGYAIMRAACARAIVATGLHPAIGIHHRNRYNPLALADDVMEPTRPWVDAVVFRLANELCDNLDLTPSSKRRLLEVTVLPVTFAGKSMSPMTAIPQYAASFKQVLCGEKRKLIVPEFGTGMDTESCG